jgi:quercetin dioxygenase-like cupin family protein
MVGSNTPSSKAGNGYALRVAMGQTSRIIQSNPHIMKKIVVLFTVAAISTWLIAAEKKESEKSAAKSATTTEHKVLKPDNLQWGDAPPGLPPGAKMTVLDGDPTKAGSFTVRLKAPPGYKVPPHTHPTTERVTGISGTSRLGMGEKLDEAAASEVAPGTFVVLPAGMAHFASFPEESIIQIQSEGPFKIKYVNPADDPRNTKK